MPHLKSMALLLIAALAGTLLGTLAACGSSEPSGESSPSASVTPGSSPTVVGTKTYQNDEYGFSIDYPESYEPHTFEAATSTSAGTGIADFHLVAFFDDEATIGGDRPVDGVVEVEFGVLSPGPPKAHFEVLFHSVLAELEN